MGLKIVLSNSRIMDPEAPSLVSVDVMESPGSLYLLDASHPVNSWDAGAPADGMALPNLFGDNLAERATGDVNAALQLSGSFAGSTAKGFAERSAKGGLHTVVSQTVDLVAGDGVSVPMPAALAAYLKAYPSNDFYVSAWDRLTRAEINPGKASAAQYVLSGVGRATPNLWYGDAGAFLASDNLGNNPGPRFGAAHAGAVSTSKPQLGAGPDWGAAEGGYHFGLGYGTSLSGRQKQFHSSVFYRFYVEDLTVSGRTFSEVSILDQELFTREVLTEGGRYYGDTFTDPATVA